jgi:hypothetical protein
LIGEASVASWLAVTWMSIPITTTGFTVFAGPRWADLSARFCGP